VTPTHTYGLMVRHEGKQYDMGAACVPTDDGHGFQIKVIVRSPVPKWELPIVVEGVWNRWLMEVRDDYSLLASDRGAPPVGRRRI